MKYILLIATFNAFFFTVFLLQKRPKAMHDNILICWLIYLGLYIGLYSFYSHDLFILFHILSISFISLLMLHGPFLYFYILTLVTDKSQFKSKDLIHLIPFVLFNLYLAIATFFPSISVKLDIEKLSLENDPPFLFLFFLILAAFSGTVYFLLTIKLFRKLDINIFKNFSYSEEINLEWLRVLVFVFGFIWTVLISVTIIHHVFHLFSEIFCTDGLFLSLSVFVILIGYFGLKQKVIFSRENIFVPENNTATLPKYQGSKLNDSETKKYSENLNSHFASNKPYLNSNLTLPQLASEIGISAHILSQLLNEHYKLNFFDFINQYRVQEFKESINKPEFKNFSLLGIAFECGFNSKSAFNRIFKKTTGFTPSQFKDNNKFSSI